jgi:hypothetical protein
MTTIPPKMPSISLSTPLSLTPLLESQASTTTALLSHIQSNWSLASPSTILPETICPSDDPQYWPIDLIEALSELSDLTPNQPERAWSLIDTYLQARIREASYTGGNKGIYARLETGDVVRASESARKMRVGREMEEVSMEMGKRKYSIRDEIKDGDGEGQVKGKKQKTTPPPPALELDTNVPTIASLLSALSPSPSPSPTQISTMALKPRPQQSHNTPFRPILPRLVTIPPPLPAPQSKYPYPVFPSSFRI